MKPLGGVGRFVCGVVFLFINRMKSWGFKHEMKMCGKHNKNPK